jgi:hypothetical protein
MKHVYRWDLDKTYLKTQFDTAMEIFRTALQGPEEKENIPGTAALIRALKRGPDGTENRIYIVSGSPREMRQVLVEKLRLDGAEVDGLTLKPNLQNLLRGRFRAVRDQLGYKLPVLLESRLGIEGGVLETCFGDDAEMDAVIYRLYADIGEGRVEAGEIEKILVAARLYPDQIAQVLNAVDRLPIERVVERICIHLDTGSPTAHFDALGPLVAPTFNAFQAALVLHGDGRLADSGVYSVADEMIDRYAYTRERLSASIQDAVRRGLVPRAMALPIADQLSLRVGPELPVRERRDGPVDYLELLKRVDEWHKERKARRRPRGLSALLGG